MAVETAPTEGLLLVSLDILAIRVRVAASLSLLLHHPVDGLGDTVSLHYLVTLLTLLRQLLLITLLLTTTASSTLCGTACLVGGAVLLPTSHLLLLL